MRTSIIQLVESICASVISKCDAQGESLSFSFHECPGFCCRLASAQLPFLVNKGIPSTLISCFPQCY